MTLLGEFLTDGDKQMRTDKSSSGLVQSGLVSVSFRFQLDIRSVLREKQKTRLPFCASYYVMSMRCNTIFKKKEESMTRVHHINCKKKGGRHQKSHRPPTLRLLSMVDLCLAGLHTFPPPRLLLPTVVYYQCHWQPTYTSISAYFSVLCAFIDCPSTTKQQALVRHICLSSFFLQTGMKEQAEE